MTTTFAPPEPTEHRVPERPPPTELPEQRSPQPRRRRRRGYLIAGVAAAALTAAGIGAATGRDTRADAEFEAVAPTATAPATGIHGIAGPTAPAVDADTRWALSMSGHTSLMNDAAYYTGQAGDAANEMDIPGMVSAATTAASKYDQLVDLGEAAPGADGTLATKSIEAWRLIRDGLNLTAEGAATLDVDTLQQGTDLMKRGTDLLDEATAMLRAKTS
jgi:hypothetical protein